MCFDQSTRISIAGVAPANHEQCTPMNTLKLIKFGSTAGDHCQNSIKKRYGYLFPRNTSWMPSRAVAKLRGSR